MSDLIWIWIGLINLWGKPAGVQQLDILYILVYRPHFWYHKIAIKSKGVLYTGQTKKEGNIWHKLGGNTIILFYNINNEYINNKQIN